MFKLGLFVLIREFEKNERSKINYPVNYKLIKVLKEFNNRIDEMERELKSMKKHLEQIDIHLRRIE